MDNNGQNGDEQNVPVLPESVGGHGGPSVRETRLLRRAIRENWDLPEAVYKAIPNVAAKWAAGQDAEGNRLTDPRTGGPLSLRSQFTAMKILLDMKSQITANARLELDANKANDARGDVNVNVGVNVGNLPVLEVVVNDRDEAKQFADIRGKLIEASGGNGEAG